MNGFSRRAVLRGLGVSMALPWLEGMGPVGRALAASPLNTGPLRAAPAPVRLAFVFMPNGVNYPSCRVHGRTRRWSISRWDRLP